MDPGEWIRTRVRIISLRNIWEGTTVYNGNQMGQRLAEAGIRGPISAGRRRRRDREARDEQGVGAKMGTPALASLMVARKASGGRNDVAQRVPGDSPVGTVKVIRPNHVSGLSRINVLQCRKRCTCRQKGPPFSPFRTIRKSASFSLCRGGRDVRHHHHQKQKQ